MGWFTKKNKNETAPPQDWRDIERRRRGAAELRRQAAKLPPEKGDILRARADKYDPDNA